MLWAEYRDETWQERRHSEASIYFLEEARPYCIFVRAKGKSGLRVGYWHSLILTRKGNHDRPKLFPTLPDHLRLVRAISLPKHRWQGHSPKTKRGHSLHRTLTYAIKHKRAGEGCRHSFNQQLPRCKFGTDYLQPFSHSATRKIFNISLASHTNKV